jgi:alpha-amylase
MTLINFFFFAHQPERLRPYHLRPNPPHTPERIHDDLFDDELNAAIFRKVANKCYYPATRLLLELIESHKDAAKPFRIAYGLSGTFLDQAQRYEPELLDLFKRLADTGLVEFTGETYYHSLSSLWDDNRAEFRRQVTQHTEAIQRHFGQRPTVFRNTECLYNDGIARTVHQMGFAGIMTEGIDWILEQWRSPDFLYQSVDGLPVLLRNYRYSDDIGYRFPNRSWEHYPLAAETFGGWLAGNTDEIVNIMMDYEALGEHIWADTGIFDFIRALPDAILKYPQLSFTTPGQAVRALQPRGTIHVGPFATISWADMERDTSAWLRNEMQQFCYEELRQLETSMMQANNPDFLRAWRLMQTSDHVYYLSDKSLSDGDVHTYFSAYGNLFESFVRLQTAITDLKSALLYQQPATSTAEATVPADTPAPEAATQTKPRTRSRARTQDEAEAIDGDAPAKPKRARKPKESATDTTP